ncbi:MAG: hypothetical protein AB7Q17_12835 [Phycisphaerae bacterium]
MHRAALLLLLVGGAVVALLSYLCPAAAALTEVFSHRDWSTALLGERRVALLWRGVRVAAQAALVAQVIGALLAATWATRGPGRLAAVAAWVGGVVLLSPPYLYAYAWSLVLLPAGVATGAQFDEAWRHWLVTEARATWCLATWLAPLAAAVLLAGWRRSGVASFSLALLDARPIRAVRAAALPAMRAWVLASLLICTALALTEFSVCHLCLVQTWNTEILAEVQQTPASGRALLLAWPLLALVVLLAGATWPFRRVLRALPDDLLSGDDAALRAPHASRSGLLAGAALIAIAIELAPTLVLAAHFRDPAALLRVWSVYPDDWRDGALGAAVTFALALALALAADAARAWADAPGPRRAGALPIVARAALDLLLAFALLAALAPPVLVGDALAAAYAALPWLGDGGLAISLAAVARFGFVPLLMLRSSGAARELAELAALDGAGPAVAFWRVRLPRVAPLALGGAALVGLLGFTEVAATQLVRAPGVGSVALTLLNAIHFGRDDVVIAASLVVFAAVGAGAALALAIVRRTRSR